MKQPINPKTFIDPGPAVSADVASQIARVLARGSPYDGRQQNSRDANKRDLRASKPER